ncbi:SusD/RagB family nutrient-binding outer membrane lipoprotein [Prolixibacteraceae bacterium Z1-6]|uniref:SusD/RagB family nutrient-binding outer membrane lipoprotein n=1 Tax=Draconibacterium aestuarii TaxID=2998507 RepID=A0A9X3J3R8_9BACT|nr:SusD/RagB family nutrient-binding outer membrane lipoprotein [Prolixibacteraceae bacterium Z1-6]
MKTLKYITLLFIGVALFSCEVDYYSDPNSPEIAPTYGIMNRVQKRFMDDTRDEWFSGRQSLLWVQYWNQVNYTEEDRFQYRETVNQGAWDDIYKNAQDLHDIIALNTAEETKGDMAQYGPNVNQIAAARIMLTYVYLHAVELWGDVPYASYGNDNEKFQANALKTKGIDRPVYASQEDIYPDMLKELDEAQASIVTGENMIDGDNFFGGDAAQWKKFANSLRLRIANRVKDVYSGAQAHIDAAIAAGVMASNGDNAGVTYEANAVNGAPMYRAFVVSARNDFAPSMQFVELLQGKRGTFGAVDPRLDVFVADNDDGFKVGIPLTDANSTVTKFTDESMPGDAILAADYTQMYMEYSEVCFIMSEINNWDQTWYEKGVKASMERWGIDAAAIDAYVDGLPAANEENVMMQKYIALYMQPMEAWSEYRRTGYPNTLVKPNETYTYTWPTKDGDVSAEYTFAPIGGLTDLPSRNNYLLNEESINKENKDAAASAIGGDEQSTKLWWQ